MERALKSLSIIVVFFDINYAFLWTTYTITNLNVHRPVSVSKPRTFTPGSLTSHRALDNCVGRDDEGAIVVIERYREGVACLATDAHVTVGELTHLRGSRLRSWNSVDSRRNMGMHLGEAPAWFSDLVNQ